MQHRVLNARILACVLTSALAGSAAAQVPVSDNGGSPAGPLRELPERNISVLRVRAQAAPGGDGTTWRNAFDDLQPALDRAAALRHVREVWVAAGTYVGGFVVPDGVHVYGGFLPGDRSRGQRRPTAHTTALDGANTQRVLVLGDGCLLDGFTVRNGRAGGLGGGGALVDGTSPRIRNCTFRDNTNIAGRGSALSVWSNAAPIVESSIFTDNGDGQSGHVIDINTSGGRYENLAVYDNFDNGLHFQFGSDPIIRNSVFALNTGRGICHISSSDAPVLEHNLLWNNGVSLMHVMGSELQTIAQINALSYASDNVTGDPLFVDAGGGDWRPSAASPCVDAGYPATFPALAVDGRGAPRVLDGDLDRAVRVDIGPYERSHVELNFGPAGLGRNRRVDFGASGSFGLTYQVWLGPEAAASADHPFGVQLFDLASASPVASGVLPMTGLSVAIPAGYSSGDVLVLQALALDGGGAGNWSNALRVVVP
jgi:hypothetical protein